MFLSLAGLLILAMIGTCLETARYTACIRQGAETLRTSADALLTEYSRPLYDHYRLCFLEDTGEAFEKVIAGYAGDSLSKEPGTMDFLGGELKEVLVKNKVKAGDDEAAALGLEIREFMERFGVGETMKGFLKKIKKVSDVDEQAEQIEDTVDEQRKDAKLDKRILRLMNLVDGVRITDSGKVSVSEVFAKKFAVKKEISGSDFGVQEATVWKSMKPQINKTPVKWKKMDASFRSMLKRVIKETEKAIEEGNKLRAEYKGQGQSDMASRVINGLPSLSGNLVVLKKTEEILGDKSTGDKEKRKTLKELWKDYDTSSLSFDYSGVDNAGGDDESPLDALGDAVGDGLLHLVCENPQKLSEKGIKKPDRYAKYYKEESKSDSSYTDRMERLAGDEEVELSGALGSLGGYALDEFTLDSYIMKMLPGYTQRAEKISIGKNGETSEQGKDDAGEGEEVRDKKWKRALDYGWEYVIAGNKSDKDNLESVLSRILLIRTVVNFGSICASAKMRAEAFAAAVAVVGFTGLTFLIKFTQTLILVAWSFVESLTDIAALLLKKHVPIVKKPGQIKTGIAEILLITNSAIIARAKTYGEEKKTSIGYREYVMLFMAMMSPKTRRYRVMDLVEADMKKNGYAKFDFGKCVFSMKVTGQYYFPAKFFRMPSIVDILKRRINGYSYTCRIRAGYL